jgi:hypothetical protein
MKRIFSKSALWGPVLFLAVAGSPGVARAQPSASDMAQARELLNEGLDLRDKGDAASALEKLKGAHALANTPITGTELGRTYLALGKLVEARETFLSVARIPPRPDETSRSKTARADSEKLADQLRQRIPTLRVKVTGVPVDTVSVSIDGASVPSAALDAPRLLNPGTHAVFARSTTGGTAETQVTLKEGEARDVELKIAFSPPSEAAHPAAGGSPAGVPAAGVPAAGVPAVAGPAAAPPAALVESPPGVTQPRSHALDWALMGGGAAIAIAGGVLMGVEVGRANDAVNRQERSAYDSAKTGWTVGLAGTIAGGVVVASGAILFAATVGAKPATTGSASLQVGVGTNGVQFGGTW